MLPSCPGWKKVFTDGSLSTTWWVIFSRSVLWLLHQLLLFYYSHWSRFWDLSYFFYQSLIYSYSFVVIQDQIQIVAQWWSVIETFHFFNFSLFYRKLYGMPGYILMELRPLAHWIWVEPPPRLPLPSLMMLTEKTLSRFHSMAMTTTSTHTVFSAMGEMKLKRECWPNFQRYMTSCFHM